MEKLIEEKRLIEVELRSLSEKVKEGSIKSADAKAEFEALRMKKQDIEKRLAQQTAPQQREKKPEGVFADIAKAMQEKRSITLSGTGVVNTIREIVQLMGSKKAVLEKVRYFYGENASTVIPIWGTSLTRPAPVADDGTLAKENTANLGNTTLTAKAFGISIPVSNETLKLSAAAFESELQGIIADTFADCMAYEIFNGTGTGGHFHSVLSDNAEIMKTAAVQLKLSDLAHFALTVSDKTDTACIFLHPAVYTAFIADVTDAHKVYREDLIRNKMVENVPVIITSYMPKEVTTGSKIAVAGDFQNYAVAVAGELNIEPKKTAGSLVTTFDVDMYLAGKSALDKNFTVLQVK